MDVFVRLLGMRPDLGPERVRDQTVPLLGYLLGVDIVIAQHYQGRHPNPLEASLRSFQMLCVLSRGLPRITTAITTSSLLGVKW
jgi:hypothetical protein